MSRTKPVSKISALAALGFAHFILSAAGASVGCSGLFNDDKEQPKPENPSPDGAGGSPESNAGAGGNSGATTGSDAGLGMAGAAASGGASGTPLLRSGSERGAGCSVKNDCEEGLSCILGVCQPLSFELVASAKECFQIDCKSTADCCGDLATEVPDHCRSRAAKCSERLPGCSPGECTRSRDCGGSGVCTGSCSISSGECTSNVDCLANKCVDGQCSLDFRSCRIDVDCGLNACVSGTCACENPAFDPADPVCSDSECDGLCLWDCERSRCTISPACENNDHCFGSTPLCVEGSCRECNVDIDCSFDKVCRKGHCETPCRSDLHCGLFEACDKGECIFVGCRSDRECTLSPDAQALGFAAGFDLRLLRCHTEDGVGRCLIPCQTDAQCPPTEVCTGGLCKYIGCETDSECKTIAGVHNQDQRAGQPWISTVECREDETEK